MNKIIKYEMTTFENIKHIDENGNEYWKARELQKLLEYTQWRRFEEVIDKAKISCKNSKYKVSDYFANVGKIVKTGIATKEVKDYHLTRYACYLIVQNGDSRKEIIALGQTYFAIQTRKQELIDNNYREQKETEKRLYQRNLTKKKNKLLNIAAKNAGVRNFGEFHNAGYKGLYNGETADDIAKRKKLRYREDILDNMESSELIANLFRIDQTEQKIVKEEINDETNAKIAHNKIGKIVRNAIKLSGGTMPEKLPTPKKSLKEIKKDNKKLKIK
jgi:hypothetical protein